MANTWKNSDGLFIKFGQDEGTAGIAGEYRTNALERITEVVITLTALGTSAAILDDNVFLPSGARITRVKVINEVAATSGGSAVLNLGLQRYDRSTELDYDGLLAAAPLADYNLAGETKEYIIGVTGVGALVGTTLSYPGYLTADYDTAAYDTGKVRCLIHWYKP